MGGFVRGHNVGKIKIKRKIKPSTSKIGIISKNKITNTMHLNIIASSFVRYCYPLMNVMILFKRVH